MTDHPGPLHHLVEGPLADGPADPPGRSPGPPGPSPGPPADPVPGTPDPDLPPPGPPVGERSPDEGVAPAAVHSPTTHDPTTQSPTTRNPSRPRTRSSQSTTAASSLPMRQVPTGWYADWACSRTYRVSVASSTLPGQGAMGAPM